MFFRRIVRLPCKAQAAVSKLTPLERQRKGTPVLFARVKIFICSFTVIVSFSKCCILLVASAQNDLSRLLTSRHSSGILCSYVGVITSGQWLKRPRSWADNYGTSFFMLCRYVETARCSGTLRLACILFCRFSPARTPWIEQISMLWNTSTHCFPLNR